MLQVNEMPGHNATFSILGVFILWFGWYGFNPGSALAILGSGEIAALAAINTTISAASGTLAALFALLIKNYFTSDDGNTEWDLLGAANGTLAGLVSITAGCTVVQVSTSSLRFLEIYSDLECMVPACCCGWNAVGHFLLGATGFPFVPSSPGLNKALGRIQKHIFTETRNIIYTSYNLCCAWWEEPLCWQGSVVYVVVAMTVGGTHVLQTNARARECVTCAAMGGYSHRLYRRSGVRRSIMAGCGHPSSRRPSRCRRCACLLWSLGSHCDLCVRT
jgi:hypothetical protein